MRKFYHNKNELEAVRSGNWKLHLKGGRARALYDLETDIREKKNVLQENSEVAARLLGYIHAFEREWAQNSRPAAFVDNPKPLSTRETQSSDASK